MTVAEPERPAARVVRHKLPDRLYHWTMAVSVLTLLATAFLPILGWKFDWVTTHWIAGLVLTAAVIFHIVRAVGWLEPRSMLVDVADLRDMSRGVAQAFGGKGPAPALPGKYSPLQKLFHAVAAVIVLALVVTGLLVLLKIDTPLWRRDPYVFADDTWAVIYIVHDLCAMATITLIMAHVYFALRPEKLWMSRSMIVGSIARSDYLVHHDPGRWVVPEQKEQR